MHRRLVIGALALVATAALALTLANLSGAGVDTTIVGIRVVSLRPTRPLLIALLALLTLVRCSRSARARASNTLIWLGQHPGSTTLLGVAGACALSAWIGVQHGSFVASAADSFGYITQAETLAGAAPIDADPKSLRDGWPDAPRTLTPLGYVWSDAQRAVPSYPPGLPLMMAAAIVIAGHASLFLVVPLSACLALVATWILGSRAAGAGTGVGAAMLLTCSPAFLLHVATPMSDVPATALWTLALACAATATNTTAVGAGLAAGVALLVRPNLILLLAPVTYALTARRADRAALRRIAVFGIGALPGVAVLLSLNQSRYGSPFASGYGSVGELFSTRYAWLNLEHFTAWIIGTGTPFLLMGLVLAIPKAASFLRIEVHRRWILNLLLWQTLAVYASYAFYLPFDSWGFLRFLLPAFPALGILAIVVTRQAFGGLAKPYGDLIAVSTVVLVCLAMWERTVSYGVLTNETSVRRFIDVPKYAATHLPATGVFLARLHSGSMRYYGGRPTVRWDQIAGSDLDRVVDALRARGFTPYAIVERSEEELFRTTFASQKAGRLEAPLAEYASIEHVRIYGLDSIGNVGRAGTEAPAPARAAAIPVSPAPVPRQ